MIFRFFNQGCEENKHILGNCVLLSPEYRAIALNNKGSGKNLIIHKQNKVQNYPHLSINFERIQIRRTHMYTLIISMAHEVTSFLELSPIFTQKCASNKRITSSLELLPIFTRNPSIKRIYV